MLEQMMYQTSAIITLQADSQTAIEQSMQRLNLAGLQVMRSFDLRVARAAHVGCNCPHHGTDQCDCQMVVLLVYDQDSPPATLVVHGHDGETQFALVDTPEQHPAPELINTIVHSITPAPKKGQKGANYRLEEKYHAR
jgi:hypothetical protein